MAVRSWYARNASSRMDAQPPFVYVWGVPNISNAVAGLQPFSEELAAYLAAHHHIHTYKFDNANPQMPFFVPVANPLDTLASVAVRMPPQVQRQNAREF
jgi:hypothetical protein